MIRHYDSGRGGLSETEVADNLLITPFQVREYLTQLQEAGVLLRVVDAAGTESFVPAVPTAALTVMQVWKMLEIQGVDQPEPATAVMLSSLTGACERLEAAAVSDAANRPLRDF